MKLVYLPASQIVVQADLSRIAGARVFEDHLRASIDAIGLVEPIKVARRGHQYVIVDGVLRWAAISAIRARDPSRFLEIPAFVVPFESRFELRYQTDIYQDLLPSQLATLVEHLHGGERVSKQDIARFIGVSRPTLRNYTGLWRLIQRGALFRKVVDLMDAGVLPSSNPYAWLRLTSSGLRYALETYFSDGQRAEAWIENQLGLAKQGTVPGFTLKFVEAATGGLSPESYRQGETVRAQKRRLGLRRGHTQPQHGDRDTDPTRRHLAQVVKSSSDPVVRAAAQSLSEYLGKRKT